MSRVALAGEILAAFLADSDAPVDAAIHFTRVFAGAESNTAIALSRQGVDCTFLGRVGADALGRAALRHLRVEGIDVRNVHLDASAPTGLLVRNTSPSGTEVIYGRQGSAGSRLTTDDVPANAFEGADLFHYTGITTMLSPRADEACLVARDLARGQRAIISFDPNIRRRMAPIQRWREVLAPHLENADIIFIGADEAIALTDAGTADVAGAQLQRQGRADRHRIVVLKDGERGARAFDGTKWISSSTPRVTSVDPGRRGDAFNGGFIAAWLREKDLHAALNLGTRLGSACVTARGDTDGLPEVAFDHAWSGSDVLR